MTESVESVEVLFYFSVCFSETHTAVSTKAVLSLWFIGWSHMSLLSLRFCSRIASNFFSMVMVVTVASRWGFPFELPMINKSDSLGTLARTVFFETEKSSKIGSKNFSELLCPKRVCSPHDTGVGLLSTLANRKRDHLVYKAGLSTAIQS